MKRKDNKKDVLNNQDLTNPKGKVKLSFNICIMLFFTMGILLGFVCGCLFIANAVKDYQMDLLESVNIENFNIDFNETLLIENAWKKYQIENGIYIEDIGLVK